MTFICTFTLPFPAQYRAGGMDLHPQCPGFSDVTEGQFGGVNANTFRFVHGTGGFVVVDVLAAQGVGIQNLRIVMEGLAQQLRLLFQHRHALRAMCNVEVAAGLRIAVDVRYLRTEIIHGVHAFCMQGQRGVQPPAGNPFRTLQPARGALGLPPISGGAAPGHAVGLQHHRTNAMLLCQRNGGAQPREAGTDDGHIHITVAVDGAVVLRRGTGRVDPVGGRILLPMPRCGMYQWIVGRIVGLPRVMLPFGTTAGRHAATVNGSMPVGSVNGFVSFCPAKGPMSAGPVNAAMAACRPGPGCRRLVAHVACGNARLTGCAPLCAAPAGARHGCACERMSLCPKSANCLFHGTSPAGVAIEDVTINAEQSTVCAHCA